MLGKYSLVTGDMTWSYSRICSYEDCPYRFFLKYINLSDKTPMFFASYGSFLHDILSRFYSGALARDQLVTYYLIHYHSCVHGKAPNPKISCNYFQQGMDYLNNVEEPQGRIIAIEKSFSFCVNSLPFTGVADLIMHDGRLVLWDHKSRALRPRSKNGKYTKSDQELDQYLRQLYLYSIAVKDLFGEFPALLAFNCYRTGQIIMEPFGMEGLQSSMAWAESMVSSINSEDVWRPNLDFFKCSYLCDVHDDCEFYRINFSKSKYKRDDAYDGN